VGNVVHAADVTGRRVAAQWCENCKSKKNLLHTNFCVPQSLVLRFLETLRALCQNLPETLRMLWNRMFC
jgi:hypothetical protein